MSIPAENPWKNTPMQIVFGGVDLITFGAETTDINGNKVAGGLQQADPLQWSKITEVFDINSPDAKIENGTVYRLDYPLQSTLTSVVEALQRSEFYDPSVNYETSAPEYDHFLNFCQNFDDKEIYTFAGIVKDGDSDAQIEKKMSAYRVINDEENWGILSAYNYTIYAPTFAAMQKAQQTMGLPTWKSVFAIIKDWESVKSQYGFTTKADAQAYVKAQLDKMAKFARYHTQNSSLFADKYFKNYDPKTGKTEPAPKFTTFCSNSLGIAQTLTVTGGNDQLKVEDASGHIVTIHASSNIANMLARDINIPYTKSANGTKTYDDSKIESSSFVTIHGIDTPLCYNKNGQY